MTTEAAGLETGLVLEIPQGLYTNTREMLNVEIGPLAELTRSWRNNQ